jgi:uncharacterized protein YebE (UPF0316 family)
MIEIEFPPLTPSILTAAGFIFVIRVIGMAFSTVRMLLMMRGKKFGTAVTGFIEVLLYVFAIGGVVNNLSNIWNILGYSLGFVAGTLVGMWLDDRTATGFVDIRIISRYKAQSILEELHEGGYGATVAWGQGRQGAVGMIWAIVRRKEVTIVQTIAETADPDVFITIEDTRTVRRGYLHIASNQK